MLTNVLSHTLQLEPHRGDRIPTGPEVLAVEVSLPSAPAPGDGDGALALEKPDDGGDRVLRGYLDAQVHVIRHEMTFHDPAFLLPGQLMEDNTQPFSNFSLDRLASILRDEDDVILAVPLRVGQTLIQIRHVTVLLRLAHQAITAGVLYCRIAQSSSGRTGQTSGLPPMFIYIMR